MLLWPVLALGACYPVGGLDGGPPAAETRGASGYPSMAKTTAVALFAYVGGFGTHPGNASGTPPGLRPQSAADATAILGHLTEDVPAGDPAAPWTSSTRVLSEIPSVAAADTGEQNCVPQGWAGSSPFVTLTAVDGPRGPTIVVRGRSGSGRGRPVECAREATV